MPVLDGRQEWEEWFENLSPAERQELKGIADLLPRCGPMEGPQRAAFNSKALVTGYGGAAGGGKTGLIALLALLEHTRSLIIRYDGKQLRGFIDDVIQFYGSTTGLNRQSGSFYFSDRKGHMLEWGGIGEPGSEFVWQGRAHDFIAADEVTQLALKKLIWLMTWLRTTEKGQRCRVLWTFNPPGAEDDETGKIPSGTWVINFFAPWIDERHPNPAAPGELRYFLTDPEGESQEVDGPEPVEIKLKDKVFMQEPQPRTFYPATVQDNEHLRGTNYEQVLLQHPEPLRSQMLLGDFRSGIVDHPKQVIPTAWVDAAQDRWTPEGEQRNLMSAMGVDVARGGRAFTVFARRHKFWWNRQLRHRGLDTPDGDITAGLVIQAVRNAAWICIDANGIGSSPYDSLKRANARVHGLMVQKRKGLKKLPGEMKIYNLRTWLYFCLRHILDPKFGFLPELPPDNRLRSDLIAPHYSIVQGGFALMESKEELQDRLKRSTDDGDAVALSCFNIFLEPETERMTTVPPPKRMGELPDAWNPDLYADNQWMNL